MRIGLDARFLTHPQPGGFKTYTINLLTALGQIDDGNEYVVYLDREPGSDCPRPDSQRFTYRIVSGDLPFVGMPYREQISLRRHMARDRLDLVHFLCNTAPLRIKIPYIVTLHDVIQVDQAITFGRTRQAHKRWAVACYSRQSILRTVGSAAQIITVSREERSRIHTLLGVPLERISVTHLAPNPIFKPVSPVQQELWRRNIAEEYGIKTPFIFTVGYEPRKNIPLVLQAFAELARGSQQLSLVVVAAQTEQRMAFQDLAVSLGLEQRIWILGALPPHELGRFYCLAELFVFPSERESFGLPPLEAMACGTPTIAMNASSIPEIVEDGAMLIDGLDLKDWVSAMHRILTEPNLHIEMSLRGLRRAAALSWLRCAEETLGVYRDAARPIQIELPFPPQIRGSFGLQVKK